MPEMPVVDSDQGDALRRVLRRSGPVNAAAALSGARDAFSRSAWQEAAAAFAAADARAPLEPEDLDRFARASFLAGQDEACIAALTRAHAAYLERGRPVPAAAAAFWLTFSMMDDPNRRAQAAGWLARARRLLDDVQQPCVEHGWVLCATAYLRVTDRDVRSAHVLFSQAAEIGTRFQNRDLLALARMGHGRCLLALGNIAEGLALLDEVMVAVTTGEIVPVVAGVVYCSVISACHDLFDLRRAQEWTTALHGWCASQPELVPFRGYCLIRRSELLQLHGEWEEALEEARRACERAAPTARRPEAGAAYYQLAELHRLRGEWGAADDAYRQASQAGRKPHPGLALLRLRQGQPEAADASIRLALHETHEARARVPVLCAATEIMIGRNDLDAARAASRELADIAGTIDAPFVSATAAQAQGAVLLAEGNAPAALESLQRSCALWTEIDAPYELARTRVLVGLAYRQLGDRDGAQLEFDAAQERFEEAGAVPDLSRVAALAAEQPAGTGGLTGREVEVLRLLATGATNRVIASRLRISEKTVARHISNIFTKLDLPSRSAATAYACRHNLV
jgi:DNA-binding CsgD family transcriptional regulator